MSTSVAPRWLSNRFASGWLLGRAGAPPQHQGLTHPVGGTELANKHPPAAPPYPGHHGTRGRAGRRADPPKALTGLRAAGGRASPTTYFPKTQRPQGPGEGHPAKQAPHRHPDQGTHPSHYPHNTAQGPKGKATTPTCLLPFYFLWPHGLHQCTGLPPG